MDPRTAYQQCHKLQYQQFKSVQGLVDATRDYQRMDPQTKILLAAHQCDTLDGFWMGGSECYVPITNWGTRPVQLEKESVVGDIEEVDLIASHDSV